MSNILLEMMGNKKTLHSAEKIRYGGRFAVNITVSEFEEILNELKLKGINSGYITEEVDTRQMFKELIKTPLCSKLWKDISKIDFGYDNFEADNRIHITSKERMPFLSCLSGGEEQIPVRFYIYWDGKSLRGYVPTAGNIFNKKTKVAIEPHNTFNDDGYYVANDLLQDRKDILKEYSKDQINKWMKDFDYSQLKINDELCLEDFESRLKY